MPQRHSRGETGCASENLQHPKFHAARAARPWGPPGHPPRVMSTGEAGVLHRARSQVWLGGGSVAPSGQSEAGCLSQGSPSFGGAGALHLPEGLPRARRGLQSVRCASTAGPESRRHPCLGKAPCRRDVLAQGQGENPPRGTSLPRQWSAGWTLLPQAQGGPEEWRREPQALGIVFLPPHPRGTSPCDWQTDGLFVPDASPSAGRAHKEMLGLWPPPSPSDGEDAVRGPLFLSLAQPDSPAPPATGHLARWVDGAGPGAEPQVRGRDDSRGAGNVGCLGLFQGRGGAAGRSGQAGDAKPGEGLPGLKPSRLLFLGSLRCCVMCRKESDFSQLLRPPRKRGR